MGWIVAELVRASRARIRQAESRDMAAVESWRAVHFAEMAARGSRREVLGQTDFSTAAWVVYTDAQDRAIAAMGFRDEGKVRWVTDLYAVSGKAGLRGGMILGALVEEMSDRDGYEIRGSTDPENTDYLQHLLRRGYEIVSVEFRRVARVNREECR